uniref:Endogenous alpha-amylase/subtilisin inhibitor n=1 Tax=Noccaea caerulescens TaxID=107243 RepID=A0A1J3CLV1_NOCCA
MKKPSVISFLTTLLLAATICTHGQEPVKDSAGNSLKTGQQYFIQPVSNKGGGLVPAAISLRICPLGIVQSLLPSQPGLPVSFKFLSSVTDSIVTISTNVTIEFKSDSWLFCNKFPKFWEVDESSPSANKEPTILIGGKPEQSNSQFKIEKAGANTYKLTSLTGTVGATPGIWGIQLVLTNDTAKTLLVEFSKFNKATTSTSRVEKLGIRMFPFY